MSKEVDVTLHAYTKGLINKELVMEVECGNVTEYCYSIADLVSHLMKLGVSANDIWKSVFQVENQYYKVR